MNFIVLGNNIKIFKVKTEKCKYQITLMKTQLYSNILAHCYQF